MSSCQTLVGIFSAVASTAVSLMALSFLVGPRPRISYISLPRFVVEEATASLRGLELRPPLTAKPLESMELPPRDGDVQLTTVSSLQLERILIAQSDAIKKLQQDLEITRNVLEGEMDRHDQMIEDWAERAAIQRPCSALPSPAPPRSRPQSEPILRRGLRGSWVSLASDGTSEASSWEEIEGDDGDVLMVPDLEQE